MAPRPLLLKPLFLFFIALGISIFLSGQSEGRSIPELWSEYEQTDDDSTQIATLSALASAYVNGKLDSALILGETALERAKKGNFRNLEAASYVSLGEVYDVAGQITPALENFAKGLKIFLELQDDKGIARAYNSRGLARYFASFELEEARADFLQAKFITEKTKDLAQLAKIHHNLAQTYHKLEQYPEALSAYLRARNLKDSLVAINYPGITVRDQISTYNNLGIFYTSIYQFANARESTKRALELIPEEELGRRAVITYTLGLIEEQDSNYTEALRYFQEGLKLAIEGGFVPYQPNMYDAIGNAYLELNSEEAANDHYLLALNILKDVNIPEVKAGVLNDQGKLFIRQKKYREAKENATQALEIITSNNIGKAKLKDAHGILAKAAEALNDYRAAAYHLRQFSDIQKELDGAEHKKEYIGLQAVFDVERNTNQFELKLKEQELAISKKWIFWLKIAVFLAVLLAIAFAIAKVQETRAKQKVESTNKELETLNVKQADTNQKLSLANNKLQQFAFATGHDLKESLRNITSFTQLAAIEMAEDGPQAQSHLKEAAAGGKRMRKMLDDLLHYSNIGGNDTTITKIALDEVISSVKQQLKQEIENTRGDVHLITPTVLKANRTEVEQIFFNLVHNALRYHQPEHPPRINIKVETKGDEVLFKVTDNGMGIPTEHRQDIFKPFFRLHNRMQSGSGLGLAICKNIVDTYGGKIWHETAENESGSVFCFTLPNAEPKPQPSGIA